MRNDINANTPSALASNDTAVPLLNEQALDHAQAIVQVPTLNSMPRAELLSALNRLIESVEISPLAGAENDSESLYPRLDWFIKRVEQFILFNRAISCTFRFKTTSHAVVELAQIAREDNQYIVSRVSKSFGLLFFATDAGITVVTSKNSVAMLRNLPGEIKNLVNLLRDDSGNLPLISLGLLLALIPGGMWGAYNKGSVGSRAIADLVTSAITDNPSDMLNTIFKVMGGVVGGSSALCFAVFNLRQGLSIKRTIQTVLADPLWTEYFKAEKNQVIVNQLITFIISVAMTLITVLATFYAKGSFKLSWQATSEALFIGLSNLMLNTFFTTGPNYIIKMIKQQDADLKKQNNQAVVEHSDCYQAGARSIQSVGIVSSLGNSFAVLPAILFILTLASKEDDLAKQSWGNITVAGIIWLLLAVPMFFRDYAYYSKPILEWYEKKFGVQSPDEITEESTTSVSVASFSTDGTSRNSSVDQSNVGSSWWGRLWSRPATTNTSNSTLSLA